MTNKNNKEIYDYLNSNSLDDSMNSAKMLEKTSKSYKREQPNLYGFYPMDILKQHSEKEMIWEYVLEVKSELAEMIIVKLANLEINCANFSSIKKDINYITFSIPPHLYDFYSSNYNLHPYASYNYPIMMNENENSKNCQILPLNSRQKHEIISLILKNELEIEKYIEAKIILKHYPLHNKFSQTIQKSMSKNWFCIIFSILFGLRSSRLSTLFYLANYYGEKVAFYYSWFIFYIGWLFILAIPGLGVFSYQIYTCIENRLNLTSNFLYKGNQEFYKLDIDNKIVPFYCLYLILWGIFFGKIWKRRQNVLCEFWNISEEKEEKEIKSFKVKMKRGS